MTCTIEKHSSRPCARHSPGSPSCIQRPAQGRAVGYRRDARWTLVRTAGMAPSEPMRKVVIYKAGGYDQLKLETHPDPKLDDRQVLIRTQAVGVNYADICVRWGVYESARRFVGWPVTPLRSSSSIAAFRDRHRNCRTRRSGGCQCARCCR